MRDLDLASRIPTKTRDDDADEMFNAKLPLTKAFSLFTMMAYGPRLPIEKARDESHRRILLRSAASYSLSMETLEAILAADRDELTAYDEERSANLQVYPAWLVGQLHEQTGVHTTRRVSFR